MKKLFYLLACIACLGFTACTDDSEETKGGNGIVGAWYITDDVEDADIWIWMLSFYEDGTFVDYVSEEYDGVTVYEDIYTGTYTYKNNTLTLNYTDGDDAIYEATVSGNTLTLSAGGYSTALTRYVE